MSPSKCPNLFIVGAMKAGTSSLHEYLHQHPQIYMSRFKEPQYFAPHRTQYGMWGEGHPLPEPGVNWYLRLFADAGDAKYVGESSVSYTARHWLPGCEGRIWNFNPDARIIYLMRDPVERAISHYWHFVAAGREDLPLREAMERRDDYMARSDYAYQIQPYINRFGIDQVYLLTLEDLQKDPMLAFRSLFRWLDIDEVPIDTKERFNVRERSLSQPRRFALPLVRFLQGWRWQLWKKRAPAWVGRVADTAAYRLVDRSRINLQPAIDYLRKRLISTMPRLKTLAGRDFPEWTTLYSSQERALCDVSESASNYSFATYGSQIDCLW